MLLLISNPPIIHAVAPVIIHHSHHSLCKHGNCHAVCDSCKIEYETRIEEQLGQLPQSFDKSPFLYGTIVMAAIVLVIMVIKTMRS